MSRVQIFMFNRRLAHLMLRLWRSRTPLSLDILVKETAQSEKRFDKPVRQRVGEPTPLREAGLMPLQ